VILDDHFSVKRAVGFDGVGDVDGVGHIRLSVGSIQSRNVPIQLWILQATEAVARVVMVCGGYLVSDKSSSTSLRHLLYPRLNVSFKSSCDPVAMT
jgi:hypothetical protein